MIRVKIKLGSVEKDLDPADYAQRWATKCDEDGVVEEGQDYPPIPDEFVVECFEEDLNDGSEDLLTLFETAAVDVQVV